MSTTPTTSTSTTKLFGNSEIEAFARGKSDDYDTPAYALEPMIKHIPKHVKVIWEPCAGNFAIVNVLRKHGYTVITSDIKTGQDMFSWQPDEQWDMILTNPPYSLKNEVIEWCYEFEKPFLLLMPLVMLETAKRSKLYKIYGLNLFVVPQRIQFLRDKCNARNASWFGSHLYTEPEKKTTLQFVTVNTRRDVNVKVTGISLQCLESR